MLVSQANGSLAHAKVCSRKSSQEAKAGVGPSGKQPSDWRGSHGYHGSHGTGLRGKGGKGGERGRGWRSGSLRGGTVACLMLGLLAVAVILGWKLRAHVGKAASSYESSESVPYTRAPTRDVTRRRVKRLGAEAAAEATLDA